MRRNALIVCILLLLALMSFRHPLQGDRISDKIQLNGFLSQGFIYTTKNDFIPQSSESGSFEFNEFALTISSDVSDKLRLGFQLLARDFGPIGNHTIKLDWGFADYRFSNAIGLRVGKIKTPIGLYNEIRDTDALYPMVVLPVSIYDEAFRPVFVAHNGIGLYGNLDIGLGRLNYHVFTGGINHPPDATYLSQIRNAINRGIAAYGMSISPLEMDTQAFYGGRLIWNLPVGLRLGGSLISMRGSFNGEMSSPMGSYTAFGKMKIKEGFFLSAEWTFGNFTLTSEYMELPVYLEMDMMGQVQTISDETQQGWYVSGSFLFGDNVTVYVTYDQFFQEKGDTEGESASSAGLPAYFGWQKDLVAGIRYDVNFNWTIKAECHFFDGVAKSAVFFPNFLEAEQKWFMLAGKISYNF